MRNRLPQVDFRLFSFVLSRGNMPNMFNDDRWQMEDYPRLFRGRDHARLGITRHSLYCTDKYPSVMPGVRADKTMFDRYPTPLWADQSWKWTALRLRAALLCYPSAVASHATAAQVYGWPLPAGILANSELHLSSSDKNSRIRHSQVTLHRPSVMSTQYAFGLPILSAVDVFIGIGPDLQLRDLVKLGDAAVGNWHGAPQTTIQVLKAAILSRPRLRKGDHIRAALELVRPTVDSPAETDLRLWFGSVGLPEPKVHPQIYSHVLGRVVEPDLGFPEVKLALEYEGEHHLRSRAQWDRDIQRDDALRDEGWTVFKVTAKTNRQFLETKIRRHLGTSCKR